MHGGILLSLIVSDRGDHSNAHLRLLDVPKALHYLFLLVSAWILIMLAV